MDANICDIDKLRPISSNKKLYAGDHWNTMEIAVINRGEQYRTNQCLAVFSA